MAVPTEKPIIRAINSLRPGAQWFLDGDDYARLVWSDPVQQKPTRAEVDARIVEIASADAAEASRVAAFRGDTSRADLVDRLKTASPSQVDTWVDNNVTNLAGARAVLKAILKTIALDQRL